MRQAVRVLAGDSFAYYQRELYESISLETAYLLRRRDNWRAVGALAKALLFQQRLLRDEVIDVVELAYTPQNQLRLLVN